VTILLKAIDDQISLRHFYLDYSNSRSNEPQEFFESVSKQHFQKTLGSGLSAKRCKSDRDKMWYYLGAFQLWGNNVDVPTPFPVLK
jgi:hypothetical protein